MASDAGDARDSSVPTEETTLAFPDYTHNAIGFYLVVIGVLGAVGNASVLAMFLRFRPLLTPTALLLVNLALADLGMSLGCCPFSASSSFARRWLYGEGGCQWYAFVGFLFGTVHIGTLVVLAVDRYVVTCKSNYRGRLTYRRYYQLTLVTWLFAAFWAAMPLAGWARYGLEPSLTTCTIDWRHNDLSYKSFLIAYFLLGYAVPLTLMGACYCAAAQRLRTKKQVRSGSQADQWANDKNVTYVRPLTTHAILRGFWCFKAHEQLKMCLTVLLAFVFSWTPYAVLCLWTVMGDPSSVPPYLTLLPPLFAKGSTVFNPLIYYVSNPRLRAGLLATLRCQGNPPADITEMQPDTAAATPVHQDDK